MSSIDHYNTIVILYKISKSLVNKPNSKFRITIVVDIVAV